MMLGEKELKDFLDEKADLYERPEFIIDDPIQVAHRFSRKEDIEIMGLLTATIAWGQRPTIIKNALRMAVLMDHTPYDFVVNAEEKDLQHLAPFVHRTFNGTDLQSFVLLLQHIYAHHGGLEAVFTRGFQQDHSAATAIAYFRKLFFTIQHPKRTEKHVSNPLMGSSAKRLNMFLRWMVRPSDRGVDFGIWQGIKPAWLSVPLDVHTGNISRQLGLLQRKQNDQKAVQLLDGKLRVMDPEDPVKYDFALFGLGAYSS